ncbi:MAG: hypothetical protein U0798_16955 [Gemmataceae bacterium]
MPPASGYSGTPLSRKLGFKSGFRCYTNVPLEEYRARFDTLPDDLTFLIKPAAPLDFVHLFVVTYRDLVKRITAIHNLLTPTGMIWISWLKKASGIPTDVDEGTIRELALSMGLVDVKVCSVDDVWSGLKLVIPVKLRPKSIASKQ